MKDPLTSLIFQICATRIEWIAKGTILKPVYLSIPDTWKCIYTRVNQDQRNFEIKRSYWVRAKIWTQGVYYRVQVQGMKKWSADNVASLFHQISLAQVTKISKKKVLPILRTNFQALIPKQGPLKNVLNPGSKRKSTLNSIPSVPSTTKY